MAGVTAPTTSTLWPTLGPLNILLSPEDSERPSAGHRALYLHLEGDIFELGFEE
jgi:hypothetical protein